MRELITASMLMEGDVIRDHGQWFAIQKIETYSGENFGRRFVLAGTYNDGAEGVLNLYHDTTVYLYHKPRVINPNGVNL